jgi:SAM-dependent methyltransferase
MTENHYTKKYFNSGLFDQNYDPIARAIVSTYQPKRVLDVGCGPGKLSRSLAHCGVNVTAIDGYASPDFSGTDIQFHPCDLNSHQAITAFVQKISPSQFDVVVCLEVAEHLNPEVSDRLVQFLCSLAPIVIFSAAVPGQGGAGHINCQPRTHWHDRFVAANYHLAHLIRPKIIHQTEVPLWYRFNLLDYCQDNSRLNHNDTTRSLLECESVISTSFYTSAEEITRLRNILNRPFIRSWLNVRALLKRWVGKKGKS